MSEFKKKIAITANDKKKIKLLQISNAKLTLVFTKVFTKKNQHKIILFDQKEKCNEYINSFF